MYMRNETLCTFRLNIRTQIRTLPHDGFRLYLNQGPLIHLMMQFPMQAFTLDEVTTWFLARSQTCAPENGRPLAYQLAHALLQLIEYRIVLIDGLPRPTQAELPLKLNFQRTSIGTRSAELNTVWQQYGRVIGHAVAQNTPRTLNQVTAVAQLFTDNPNALPPVTVAHHLIRLAEVGLVSMQLNTNAPIEGTAV